jgi:hypothetical protein
MSLKLSPDVQRPLKNMSLNAKQKKAERRVRRRCRSYQREWRGHCVDMNLEDAWLESLNSLIAFDLISICEGHRIGREGRGRRHAHVNLRLKESLVPITVRDFDGHAQVIQRHIVELFGDGRSNVEVDFHIRVRSSLSRNSAQRVLVVRINASHERASESLDEESREWFTTVLERVGSLDCIFGRLFFTGQGA